MKPAILLIILFLPLTLTATVMAQGGPMESAEQTEPFPLHRYTLANGLQVWCQPRTDSESIAALLVLRAGARYENSNNNGISHFVEHMLFTGTDRWTEEEIKAIIEDRGGRWNGWTGREQTTYFAQLSAEDIDLALDWLAELVFHPTFPPDKVEKERQVIFQEKWGRYGWLINTIDALGFGYELDRDIRRALFPDSTLGLRIVGEDDSLDNIDRKALQGYYQGHYTPDNAVLIVAGQVDPTELLGRIETYFGDLTPQGRPESPETPALPATGPHQVVVRGPMPTDQTRLVVGTRTVGRTHPDRWPLEVLAEILEKELKEEIRYRRGLVYSLGAYNSFYDDVGYFGISTVSESGNRETILKTIETYLEEVSQNGVSPQQLAEAQGALKGRWALSMENNVDRAVWLADWSSVLAVDESVPDYPAEIDRVSPEDVRRVVHTYFTPERRYQGMHQPVVTVVSGALWAGAVLGLGLAAWLARRVWRRTQSHRLS